MLTFAISLRAAPFVVAQLPLQQISRVLPVGKKGRDTPKDTPAKTFSAHLSDILRHRCSLHPFEGLRWAGSERGYPSAPIRAVLCRILDMNFVEFPFHALR